ncbi:MAG: protein-tyrosine-phosphatase [Bacteroidota bacterium]
MYLLVRLTFLFHLMTYAETLTSISKLEDKIVELQAQENLITPNRLEELNYLAGTIHAQKEEMGFSKVTWVCTHNSRRSQLAQIWFWKALQHYKIEKIKSYSGGTETTAFNHRMVKAVKDAGFRLYQRDETENPRYAARIGDAYESELLLFSKKFTDEFNPQKDFIAVMVCSQADQECPFVPGAYTRVALPYEDPKVADDTPQEGEAYAKKVDEIGREVLYLIKQLSELESK